MDAVINLRHEPRLREEFDHARVVNNTVLIDRRTKWVGFRKPHPPFRPVLPLQQRQFRLLFRLHRAPPAIPQGSPKHADPANRARRGTRIEDRRLNHADDLRKCLAFDAITAFLVWDLTWLARDRPDQPAARYVEAAEIRVLFALATRLKLKVPRGPLDPDIRAFVCLTAGLTGFHSSKRQPLPGTQKLWQGLHILSTALLAWQAFEMAGQTDGGQPREPPE